MNMFSFFLMALITTRFFPFMVKLNCLKNGFNDRGPYFYKNKKYGHLEMEKKDFFSYFISEIPNFSYMFFLSIVAMIVMIKQDDNFF